MFDATESGLASLSNAFTDGLHDGSLRRYLAVFVATALAVGGAAFLGGDHLPGTRALTPAPFVAILGWLLLMSACVAIVGFHRRSEEHTSELQSLMRISYAVFCLKKKKIKP